MEWVSSDQLPVEEVSENDEDDDLDSEDEVSSDSSIDDDRYTLKRTRHPLGLNKNYVPDWRRKDAFRELYQNWKDAIIESFSLEPRSFKPEFKDLKNEIQITLRHPHLIQPGKKQGQLCGYIRFKKKFGILELTNFKATLSRYHLEMGGTTKRGNDKLAGVHGEGFKVAALVMRRNQHRVRFAATSCYWNFAFGGASKENFYCSLSPAKDEKIERLKRSYAAKVSKGTPRGLTANMWEDVSLTVGKARGILGQKIAVDDFLSWIKVTLDINGPCSSEIVQTDHGDLILDKTYAGKIYLKGLLISDGNSTAKPYIFGYNLLRGLVNRDRQRLTNPDEEAVVLVGIWDQAIRQRMDILDKYIDLLQDYHSCADVALAETKISKEFAEVIWKHLRTDAKENNVFYYCENHGDKDCNLIRRSLKKHPSPLSVLLWNLLLRFRLIRTPQDQREYLFNKSEPANLAPTTFGLNVSRALQAALALDSRSSGIKIRYVKGGDTGIELLLGKNGDDRILRIHEKWLSFEKVHETAGCQVSRLVVAGGPELEAFSCDHVVEELHELALQEIENLTSGSVDSTAYNRSLRREIRDKLRQMPRMIQIAQTEHAGELEISWADSESGLVSKLYGSSIEYLVILHRNEICSKERNKLLLQTGPRPSSQNGSLNQPHHFRASCGCPSQIACQATGRVVFGGLNASEMYFPMIARVGIGTFFGHSPMSASPKAKAAAPIAVMVPRALSDDGSPEPMPSPIQNGAEYNHRDDGNDDLYREPTPTMKPRQSLQNRPVVSRANGAESSVIGNEDVRIPPSTMPTMESYISQWQDMRTWESWEENDLPKAFEQFIPKRVVKRGANAFYTSSLVCQHLECTFENGEYVQIQVRPPYSAGSVTDHIIFIHDIGCEEDTEGKSYHLLVSKYSFLGSSPPFNMYRSKDDNARVISKKELLLHFEIFNSMGERQDAEVIQIKDIVYARDVEIDPEALTDTVEHLVQLPQDPTNYGFFCRFAVRNNTSRDSACITPIGSKLLRHRDRWKSPKFKHLCKPTVFDLSPGVLGPSEGFSQASCRIHAAFGFDPICDMTWRIRHHSASVYDNAPENVLADFASAQLVPPEFEEPEIPKIALISGSSSKFMLSGKADSISPGFWKQSFLSPLHALNAVATSTALGPRFADFLLLTISSAILHETVISEFLESIMIILEKRYSVHLRMTSLQEHNIPQSRTVIVLLASPICAAPRWDLYWPQAPNTSPDTPMKTVRDMIGDLSLSNSRTGNNGKPSFVCKYASSSPSISTETDTLKYIYNHITGVPGTGAEPVELDTSKMLLDGRVIYYKHPIRGDSLTVRELARIQGFEDDFIFYGFDTDAQVVRAFPPSIAKKIAKMIIHIVQDFRVAQLGEGANGVEKDTRGTKRARIEE